MSKITWNLQCTLKFNYIIVGHVNDRSRKIEARYAFPALHLEIQMRKNCRVCSILLGPGIGLSIARRREGKGARITGERFSLALGNTCQSVSRILTRRVILCPLSPVTLPIAGYSLGTREYPARRRHRRHRVRTRRHIGNSVSTIIPRTIRKTCRTPRLGVTGHRRTDCAQHPESAIRRDIRIPREKKKQRGRESP